MAIFTDIFEDITHKGRKIPSDYYLRSGKYQIIDQGKDCIAGFCDENDGLFEAVPAIIFGDHTRILKYVDKPFFIGADGVKVLRAKEGLDVDYKYLYYALNVIHIIDAGYSRHFKYLKESDIVVKDIEEQHRIANNLDKLEELISAANLLLAKLDELVKAKFVEMFGDVNINNKKWRVSKYGVEFQITSGGTPSTVVEDYWKNGEISWIGSNMCKDLILRENDGKYITELGLQNSSAKIFEEGTVLVALVGATIGRTALLKFATATNQNIAAIIVKGNDLFIPEFVYFDLQEHYGKFQDVGKGKFKMANQAFVRDLPIICPPRELQNQFADYVCKVDGIKNNVRKNLNNLETLKKSLMQEYFG